MPTVGAKNQPIIQTTDSFNPANDINTLSNWVANNYASTKILTGATLRTSLTGADLFAGLTVWEQSTGQFWTYDGSAWVLQPIGTPPRIELTQTVTQSGYLPPTTAKAITNWTTTASRGGMSVSSGVVTVPVAGRYNVYFSFTFGQQATAVGTRLIQISTASGVIHRVAAPATNGAFAHMTLAYPGLVLTAGDTLTPTAFQSSGATLDWYAASNGPSKFIVEYAGA